MPNNTLSTIPPELLLHIVERLTSFEDLGCLVRTCHALHDQLSPTLYRLAFTTDPDLLPLACLAGGDQAYTVAKLLAAGDSPFFQQLIIERDKAKRSVPLGRWLKVMKDRAEGRKNNMHPSGQSEEDSSGPWELRSRTKWRPGIRSEDVPSAIWQNDEPLSRGAPYAGWSPMHIAAYKGHTNILKVLLDCDNVHRTRLLESVSPGWCPVRDVLPRTIRRRERLPVVDLWDTVVSQDDIWTLHTPLRVAICAEREDAAIYLIQQGAKLDFVAPSGSGQYEHALHVAARHGCRRVLRHICAQYPDIDLDILDGGRWSPLCNAIASPYPEDTVACLLELGARVNASLGDDSFTHLHLACWRMQWSCASMLLAAGAEVEPSYTADFSGRDPEREPVHPVLTVRAIDLVCMETHRPDKLSARGELRNLENEIEQRCKLLTSLIRDYKASTKSLPTLGLPSSFATPVHIAASNPLCATDLLDAFRQARVYFHSYGDLLATALDGLEDIHPGGFRPDELEVVDVVLWLIRHGVRHDPQYNRLLCKGIWRLVDGCRFMETHPEATPSELLVKVTDMLYSLVKKGGMDANLPSIRLKPGERYGKITMLRALCRVEQTPIGCKLGKVLWKMGAKPTHFVDAIRDFALMLPPMEGWEVSELQRTLENEIGSAGIDDGGSSGNDEGREAMKDISRLRRRKAMYRKLRPFVMLFQTIEQWYTTDVDMYIPTTDEICQTLFFEFPTEDVERTGPVIWTRAQILCHKKQACNSIREGLLSIWRAKGEVSSWKYEMDFVTRVRGLRASCTIVD